ncbi:hypothetical protein ACOMHN_054407 [Nucella lapillus]
MADMTGQFRLPPTLDLMDGNLSETFRAWKRQVDFYLLASGASENSKPTQTAIILHCAGVQVQEVYEHFTFDEEDDKKDPAKVFEKLAEYCAPRSNEVIETFRFWNHPLREPFDAFLTDLRSRANLCNFGTAKDRMIRDKIVFTTTGKMQELLLREKDLTLQRAVEICRSHEVTAKQTQEMTLRQKEDMGAVCVDKVAQRLPEQNDPAGTNQQRYQQSSRLIQVCNFCGRKHEALKTKCPAWGKQCRRCNGKNHFQAKCRSTVHALRQMNQYTEDDEPMVKVTGARITGKERQLTAIMRINDRDVRFQLDSGADVNIICEKHVKKKQLRPTQQKLTMYNGSVLTPVGEATLDVENPQTAANVPVQFTVVPNNLTCLLGVGTIQEPGLITVNASAFVGTVIAPDHTKDMSLGDLGEAKLTLRPETKPRGLPCRRIPFAIQEEVRLKIEELERRGVLARVQEPTPWVSQLAVTRKKSDGSLRICIDPQPLNEALMREHFRMPTLDDVLPTFHNAKVFSKLDVKEAFWHLLLDEESSMLTTMITPFGRYRWCRLPFGLSVSSEIFQRRLTDALSDLPGIVTVADDITVVGRGSTQMEYDKDHRENLDRLKKRCRECNIKLNKQKAVLKQEEVTFMGHRISKTGVRPDEAKIAAILNMPPPTDVHGICRLCGMIQYLAKFVPNLASDLKPIRALTKKDAEWVWSPECDSALKTVKDKITQAPVLAFFDPNEELVLQVDSSKDGLGAVLMQRGRPLEYASRALTATEQRWAQIEKETLSLVLGLERFDQYTFGRPVQVHNDHKPLATILKKPLSQASCRIQALMMRL